MKVAFLDRDGVINKDVGYVYKTDDFELMPGCVEALTLIQQKGYDIIVVTNQSGIGRGYYTEADYQHLTSYYCQLLADKGVTIKDVFHCPHTPDDNCHCRKPACGLFVQASEKYSIDFANSLMVGDKQSDIDAARKMNIPNLYLISVKSPHNNQEYTSVNSLLECVEQLK